jgi:bacillithiol system protein YtxJ
MNWIPLKNIEQLAAIEKESFDNPVLIFKHSTRCHISRSALRMFESELGLKHEMVPYFLDLLEFRDVSNEIASRFGVQHQSPQIIIIKDGKAIYNASHERIDATKLVGF